MALGGATIWEVQTGGSDTANGGCFDPSQTAGMFSDGAATSATGASPVFSSASYNFVAGDAGAWLFIASGTNWIPGWYKIASVASNVATLTATIGTAVVSAYGTITGTSLQLTPSTVQGCATVASPTGATWSIDYSQQASAQHTYTDLASAGTGLTVSSAAKPFAKEQVGNSIVITGGTNFNTGRYVIASVAAGVATVVGPGNITTGAGASGTGGQGGAVASPGAVTGLFVTKNLLYAKTATYTVTSASTNVSAGCISIGAGIHYVACKGYDTVRGDLSVLGATGTRPTLIASGISTFTLFTNNAASVLLENWILDGASLTSSKGVSGNNLSVVNVHGKNFTNGFIPANNIGAIRCSATGCSSVAPFANLQLDFCEAYANTVTGFSLPGSASAHDCISSGNSGASSDGFVSSGAVAKISRCVAYGNGRDGFRITGSQAQTLDNCLSEANSAYGFNVTAHGIVMQSCGAYNNTSGALSLTGERPCVIGQVTGTASFFTDAASGDFSLNNTAGGGAAARAAGYPGLMPRGTTTGYADIGAAQHQDSATGGFVGIIGG